MTKTTRQGGDVDSVDWSKDPEVQAHEARINDVLRGVCAVRTPELVEARTPLSELIESEDGEDDDDRHRRDLGMIMAYFFADGPHPAQVVRRVFAVARAVRPELIGHLNGTQLALMFGETRAAQSWRVKKVFNRTIEQARNVHVRTIGSAKASRARFQKRKGTCVKYAAAQVGNHNRAKGEAR